MWPVVLCVSSSCCRVFVCNLWLWISWPSFRTQTSFLKHVFLNFSNKIAWYITILNGLTIHFERLLTETYNSYAWVTLRPTVGRLDFFMLISRKICFQSADWSSYIENNPNRLTSSTTKFFNLLTIARLNLPVEQHTISRAMIGRRSADWSNYNMTFWLQYQCAFCIK